MALLEMFRPKSKIIFTRLPADQPLVTSNESHMTHRTKTEGENDILRVTKIGLEEGAWMFSVDRGDWFNLRTGYQKYHHPRLNLSYYTTYFVDVADYSSFGLDLIHYHTHNLAIYEEMVANFIRFETSQAGGKPIAALSEIAKANATLNIAIPSSNDIATYLYMRNNQSHGEMALKIYHPFGITTTHLSHNLDHNENVVMDVSRKYAAMQARAIETLSPNDLHLITTATNYINQQMSGLLWLELSSHPGL